MGTSFLFLDRQLTMSLTFTLRTAAVFFMLIFSQATYGQTFEELYQDWKQRVIEDDLLSWPTDCEEADELIALGPNNTFPLINKLKTDVIHGRSDQSYLRNGILALLRYSSGVYLTEPEYTTAPMTGIQIQTLIQRLEESDTESFIENEVAYLSANYQNFKRDREGGAFLGVPLSKILIKSSDIRRIWFNGVFALPFMVTVIANDNDPVIFLAFLNVTMSSDEYMQFSNNPDSVFSSKEEKKNLIRLWWEGARHTFSELPELQNQLDAVLIAPPFALYAYHSLLLDQNVVVTGDIGVREKQSDITIGIPDTEITVLQNAFIAGNLYADAIQLKNKVNITGVVVSNELTTANGVALTEPRETTIVLPVINPVTDFPAATPGETAISVAHGNTQSLAPGSYAALNIETQATLELTTGTYHFQDITLGQSAKIVTNGSCEVRVAGRLSVGNNCTISPISGAQLDAGELQFFIVGMNGSTGALDATPKAVGIGNNCNIQARLIAPNGTLELGNGSNVQGVLVAKWLDIGQNCVITKQ